MATGIGVIGCGNISGIYLTNLQAFPQTQVIAVADLDVDRARAKADEHGIANACSVEELLAMPEVEIVLNLAVPKAHATVANQALDAGRHVYNEKPLTVGWEEGQALCQKAKSKGLTIGCAPDTVLGAGIQTCREAIDSGLIGEVVAVEAFMVCPGHESWHPDPAFYYEKGGGPMFDMGPYYLTALTTLLGAAKSVSGSAKVSFPKRLITSQPKHGQEIIVETPTHLSTTIDFANGATAHITTSFDVVAHSMPHIEVYGSEGTLRVPDPNGFGGPVQVWRRGDQSWSEVPVVRPYPENTRGLGVLDQALAIQENRRHRANGDVGLHVLEIMHAAHWSAEQGRRIDLQTTMERPAAMPSTGF